MRPDLRITEQGGKRTDRLEAVVATNPEWGEEISHLELFDDDALWNAAQTRMPSSDSERMEELHRKQRVTGLSEIETQELARLEQRYERVILVRSHSTSLLAKRGHDIRSLISATKIAAEHLVDEPSGPTARAPLAQPTGLGSR